MSVREISTLLQSALQNGQLALTENTVPEISIGDVLRLFNISEIPFTDAVITALDDSVTVSGKATAFGVESVGLTVTFAEENDAIAFFLATLVPKFTVPGAPWLVMRDAQIAIKVVSDGSTIAGSIGGAVVIEDVTLASTLHIGKVDGEMMIEWLIPEINFSAIARLMLDGVALPEELPDFAFANVQTRLLPERGAFSFSAESAQPMPFPANGGGLTISHVDISVERTVDTDAVPSVSQINCAVHITGEEPVELAADLTLTGFDLSFELEGSDWTVAGAVGADVLEASLTLAASYSQIENQRTFTLQLQADPQLELVNINGVGLVSVGELALTHVRETDEAGAVADSWEFSADGRMMVESVFDFDGTLAFQKDDSTASFVFTPRTALVELPLDGTQAEMQLSFGGVSIVRRQTALRPTYAFEAEAGLAFEGLHPTVQDILKEGTTVTFKADSDAVRLTADRLVAPVDFKIPDIEISADLTVPMGTARIDLTDLAIQLDNSIQLSARIGVGLPSELNHLFGTEQNGEPSLPLFNTFDAEDPDNTTVELELAIDSILGIRIIPRTSFIKAVELVEENGVSFWNVDLGAFGAVRLQVPVFSYDTTRSSFAASGGFETIRPLALPLTPFKKLFEVTELQAIADLIPTSLPLRDIHLLDDNNNLRIDQLLDLIEEGTDVPDEVRGALDLISDRFADLPERLREYLNVTIPESFNFNIAVTPTGEVRFDFGVKEGDEAVKLMTPSVLGLIPGLLGVELRRIAFGTLAGGSLFSLDIDAEIDHFDVLTLAGSLLLPDNVPLPDSKTLHRRLILNNLFMVIVYQTGIPIPIPMFYDKLAIQSLGFEGVQFETQAQFPMPSFNLSEISEVLSNFKRFFTERDFLLDPNDKPEDVNLRFSLPLTHNYLQLPQYLGSQRLGSTQPGIELDLYENLAHLLNGLKTLSVNELIQAMPLQHRVGSAGVTFGPASLNTGWMITTPQEFRQVMAQPSLRNSVLSPLSGFGSAEQALTVLPQVQTGGAVDEEGLVVFLRGGWDLANVARFETQFGLAASESTGFKTGFRMSGAIANTVSLDLAGTVAIQTPATAEEAATAFNLQATSRLTVQNHVAFAGSTTIRDDGFIANGLLDLWAIKANASLEIYRDRAIINGSMSPINVLNGAFVVSGAQGEANPSVFVRLAANEIPQIRLSAAVSLLQLRTETLIDVSQTGFQFKASGRLFDRFSASIEAQGSSLQNADTFRIRAQMQNDLFADLNQRVRNLIQQQANSATAELRRAEANVNSKRTEVSRLDTEIARQRSIIQGERDRDSQRLRNAQADVQNKRNSLAGLENEIRRLEAERNREGNRQICVNWPLIGRRCGPDPAGLANATRLQGIITAKQAELQPQRLALEAAIGVLRGLEAGAVLTPIDADPRVFGLIGARETAFAGLTVAERTLSTTRQAVGAMVNVADFIARNGLGRAFDVRAASFDTVLSAARGGRFAMRLDLIVLDHPQTLMADFNVNDLEDTARRIAQQVLPK